MAFNVGLVGTGYAAKLRAETLQEDGRSHLLCVAGHFSQRTAEFADTHGLEAIAHWQDLVQRPDLDLVLIAAVNRDHGAMVRAALEAGKHVVVEYPLSLEVAEAEALIALATQQNKLLHVEHIELLSGIHQAIQSALPEIGIPFYVRYSNLSPQHPAPQKWTYQPELFGFPLVGALSRVHRLTNLFGTVKSVSCQNRYWSNAGLPSPYTSCLCTAQLRFVSGLVAEVSYGKGEAFWLAERAIAIQGEQGAILFEGEKGKVVTLAGERSLDLGSRRGLFARDTQALMDYFFDHKPLYVSPQESLYALQVADAARRSAETGETIYL